MNEYVFPIYNVEHLTDAITCAVNGNNHKIESIGLERLNLLSEAPLKKESDLNIDFTIFTKAFEFEGQIDDSQYDREHKIYTYQVRIKFSNKFNFLKWLAVMKGIHRSRFKT